MIVKNGKPRILKIFYTIDAISTWPFSPIITRFQLSEHCLKAGEDLVVEEAAQAVWIMTAYIESISYLMACTAFSLNAHNLSYDIVSKS